MILFLKLGHANRIKYGCGSAAHPERVSGRFALKPHLRSNTQRREPISCKMEKINITLRDSDRRQACALCSNLFIRAGSAPLLLRENVLKGIKNIYSANQLPGFRCERHSAGWETPSPSVAVFLLKPELPGQIVRRKKRMSLCCRMSHDTVYGPEKCEITAVKRERECRGETLWTRRERRVIFQRYECWGQRGKTVSRLWLIMFA